MASLAEDGKGPFRALLTGPRQDIELRLRLLLPVADHQPESQQHGGGRGTPFDQLGRAVVLPAQRSS